MRDRSTSLYKLAEMKVRGDSGKVIAGLVLLLSGVAWWRQGFSRAFLGGLVLYTFLIVLLVASHYIEERARVKRESQQTGS